MKFLFSAVCIFLVACSHTERKIEWVDINIPNVVPDVQFKEIKFEDPKLLDLSFSEVKFDQVAPFYWVCGGVYMSDDVSLANLSLSELEKNYGALIMSSSYKKWVPIEGEPQTVLVFNFKK